MFGRRTVSGADLIDEAVDAVKVVRRLWDITPRPPQGQPVVAALAHARSIYEFASRSVDLVFITPRDDDQLLAMLSSGSAICPATSPTRRYRTWNPVDGDPKVIVAGWRLGGVAGWRGGGNEPKPRISGSASSSSP